MAERSKIEWTDATWNPVTGCTKVSQGCKNCYAKYKAWPRLKASKGTVYFGREFEDVQCHPERLDWPYRRAQPSRIFVNSMSDLFHEAVPFEFIARVFWIMSVTTRHTYQVLTKRPTRMLEFFEWADESFPFGEQRISEYGHKIDVKWTPWREGGRHGGYDNCGPAFPYENVWLGVSVEDQATAHERINDLLKVPAVVRWLSLEPLLGPVDVTPWLKPIDCVRPDPHGRDQAIDWVVCGGESGSDARPMNPQWARDVRDQCLAAGVPFFHKQNGEFASVSEVAGPGAHYTFPDGRTVRRVGKKAAGRLLDGVEHNGFPT